MKPPARSVAAVALLGCLAVAMSAGRAVAQRAPAAALASWNEGPAKQAIVDFVRRVIDESSPDYVPPAERIAVFDNDGTLWCEQPMYVQLAFALDRVKAMAKEHPEWKQQQPFQAALAGDLKTLAASGKKGLAEIVTATHAGMTSEEFAAVAADWLRTARHPRLKRPYTECVYQPMLELLDYLRSHGFKTFIVSGGGIEFMRVFAEEAYGIPPEQVIGSTIKTRYDRRDGKPALVRLAELDFIDDQAGKPVAIGSRLGRRPLLAFGNSDGDFEMLEWTTSGPGPRLGLIVHHTDAKREYAYDRQSPFGQLDRGLDEAGTSGWLIVDMAKDWNQVFPAENSD